MNTTNHLPWRIKKSLCATFCVWAATVFLVCCGDDDTPKTEALRPVRTMLIESAGAGRQRSFSGKLKAAVEPKLSFRVDGTIDSLSAKIGLKVKKGDIIARLDPTDYVLEVKQTSAQLAKARAQFKKAREDYNRNKQLYEVGNISSSELDQSLAAFQSGKAELAAMQKALELAQKRLSYCNLKAPIAGAVASVPVEVHQTVKSGEVIATLAVGGKMEMEIGVPETLISRIKVGDNASIIFDAVPAENFQATVSEVGVEITETSTYPVKLQLVKTDTRLRSGMVGEVTLTFKSASGKDIITIPPVAVLSAPDGQKSVWLYQPAKANRQKGIAKKQDIEIGTLTSRGLIVKQGLGPGDIVVIRGVHRLTDGMRIRLLDQEVNIGESGEGRQ